MPNKTRGVGLFTAENIVAVMRAIPESDGMYSSPVSPNPPKGSGHPEEARDERSRLETAWP